MERRFASAGFTVLVAVIVLFSGACATKKTGYERSERTTTSMQKVQDTMNQASDQIDMTNASLREVIMIGQSSSDPAEIKKSFDAYSENVQKMEQVAQTMNKDIDEMNSRGNDYFEEWSKQGATYTNPEIQRLSQTERNRLTQSFNQITASSAGMRGSLNAYVSDIKQIQSFLANNLTIGGISSILPVAGAAERDGNNLKRSFEPVRTAIAKARTEMTPGAAAGGGAPSSEFFSGETGTSGAAGGVPQSSEPGMEGFVPGTSNETSGTTGTSGYPGGGPEMMDMNPQH